MDDFMRRFLALTIALSCLVAYPACAIPLSGQLVSQTDLEKERAALRSAINLSQQKDVKPTDLRDAMQKVVADGAFSSLTAPEKHGAYLLLGAAQYDSHDFSAALATLKISSEMEEAVGFDWKVRLFAAYELHDNNDCILSLTKLAMIAPDQVKEVSDGAIFSIADNAAKNSDQAPGEELLLKTLFLMKWRPSNLLYTADDLWFSLARIQLESGDVTAARESAETITRPAVLIEIRADKRFDAIVGANPTHYDVNKAHESFLHELQTAVAATPDKLEGVNALAEELIVLNRPSEALALVDATLAQAEPVGEKPSKYTDYDDYINWLHNTRSRALWMLGRYEEAVNEMANGAKLKERGGVNVSQAINLADTYNAVARPNDALAAVATIGILSPYGQMALEEAKACAYYQLHDASHLAEARTYLDSHVADGIRAYLGAMLCIGDLDAAAKSVIAELEHPQRRDNLLSYLQDYSDLPHRLAFDIDQDRKWHVLKRRSDVRAEIDKVGHVEKYAQMTPLY